MLPVDAIFLNLKSRGGAGLRLWQDFLKSDVAHQMNFQNAPVFQVTDSDVDRVDKRPGSRADDRVCAAHEWAIERVKQGCRRFVAVGGDGTVHLAINALRGLSVSGQSVIDEPIQVGAVGLGSSNDFHKPFQTFHRTEVNGLKCRLDFKSSFPHDLGEVECCEEDGSSTRFVFAVNSSVGLAADANYFFNQGGPFFNAIKRRSVSLAITLASVRELILFRPISLQVQIDGLAKTHVKLVNLGVVKSPYFAGDLRYDVQEAPDSGFLGVHVYGTEWDTPSKISKWHIVETFLSLMRGQFSGRKGTFSTSAVDVTISSPKPFTLETDGEVRKVNRASLRVLPKEMYLCP